MEIGLDHLRAALALTPFDDEAARLEMAHTHRLDFSHPETYRDGSVLILFFPGEEGLTLVLTRRTDTVEHHRRQISFPGGKRENGEALVMTALRETEEEIGIPPETVEILGEMVTLRIPVSGFVVHPFVGYMSKRPEYRIDSREVGGVIEAPLSHLLDPERRREEKQEFRGREVMVPFYDLENVDRPPLWGATAMMLSGLIERLRAVLHLNESVTPSD
jgi:8-oxo-dGTP pyrophosphatase MutT (NUDIX family)